MSLRATALKIPAQYRRELLAGNVIYKAIPIASDGHMKVLFAIWRTYLDPNGTDDLSCPYCTQNILKSFKSLLPEFIEIAKEEALMDEL